MTAEDSLYETARQLARQLEEKHCRIVLAESCTAGLIAASLGRVPGISRFLCGSAVVYRERTKTAWLGVERERIERATAVSAEVTKEIASGVLRITPEADWAMGITGHLGPDSPPDMDGHIFLACYRRSQEELVSTRCESIVLSATSRSDRQREAAKIAMQFLSDELNPQ